MTPRDIAQKLASYYREKPDRWIQGDLGSLAHGCCLLGGALDICTSDGFDTPHGGYPRFKRALASIIDPKGLTAGGEPGRIITNFNDRPGQRVESVIEMLERVP